MSTRFPHFLRVVIILSDSVFSVRFACYSKGKTLICKNEGRFLISKRKAYVFVYYSSLIKATFLAQRGTSKRQIKLESARQEHHFAI